MAERTGGDGGVDAAAALASADRMTRAGIRRGLPPRWFGPAMALWVGGLAVLVGLESVWTVGYAVMGVVVIVWLRDRTGAWMQEVGSRREYYLVHLPLGLLVGAVMVGGNVAYDDFGVSWAPWAGGAALATLVFVLTEIGYGRVRARLAASDVR